LRKIADNGEFLVEANDLGAVHLLAGKSAFVAGAYLNVYSCKALEFYRELGAVRWVMPIELGEKGLREILQQDLRNIEVEIFSYGRLPLAVSARCFTARYHNLSKDDCGFKCLEYAEGLTVSTQDDEAFLVLNGVQTQSASVYNLVGEIPTMIGMGVDRVRISPQSAHTGEVVRLFHAVASGATSSDEAYQQMRQWAPAESCDGYWYGQPGMERVYATRRGQGNS
jgi:O2-independent ubiquinone biosynthesis protein UbiV